MFYSNNDNYMQDLYFYNQMPQNTYNPNMNNFGNQMPNNMGMMNNAGSMYMGQNQNMFNNQNQMQSMSSLYPSIYRIINPVVSRVIQNSNYQYFNEDVLNNMVDTVYNIVEGQIEYDEEDPVASRTSTTQNDTNNVTTNSSNTGTTTRQTETRQQTTQTTNISRNNRNDSLLRDIIKIIILKELIFRNSFQNMQPQQQFNQNPYCNNMNF